ncbi:TauD/TfdA family dioxygenase [Actinophytocola gossypii]|uniref:TauD/TfdA family dioxygenase n=1 Tax=Actinophytocola gossypii TaxID=2812003 RepID=A0ABT2JAN7_9PSEU|nr:TauD/TfdA family dioxygenase [Actinophytocola gossypii]MCT2584644.1 TauD/TfdA family dioxygenase [Actinophytocola gossypii]
MRPMVENSSPTLVRPKLSLTAEERQYITQLAIAVKPDPKSDPEAFCSAARSAGANLPERVRESLQLFARSGSSTGTLLIEGLAVGPVPSTPVDNTYHVGETTMLARAQAMISETIGHLVAYEAEGFGRLFQDMVPTRQAAKSQTSLSSLTELELHTEQAFSALRPDYLSMACLRGDLSATTYTLTARQVGAFTPAEYLATLWRDRWMTGVDESFRVGGHDFEAGEVRGPMPILQGAPDDPFIVLDQDLMVSTTPAAKAAFETVLNVYRAYRDKHVLKPGDLLLVDNNRTVHGRSPFRPRYDGSDRFVIRAFITNDLTKSRYARPSNGRTIDARYS